MMKIQRTINVPRREVQFINILNYIFIFIPCMRENMFAVRAFFLFFNLNNGY